MHHHRLLIAAIFLGLPVCGTAAADATVAQSIPVVEHCAVPTDDPGTLGNTEIDDIDWCSNCAPFPFTRLPQAPGPAPRTRDLFGDLIVPSTCAAEGCPLDLEIHGGGWVNYDGPPPGADCRDPAMARHEQCMERREGRIRAARLGVATFVAEYPLQQKQVAENSIPDQVAALLCAVRWLTANGREGSGTYKIDMRHFMVTGYSAGGQLAALLGPVTEQSHLAGRSGYDTDRCPFNAVPIHEASAVAAFYGFYHLEREPPASITARALNVIDPGAPRRVPDTAGPPRGVWAANPARVQKYAAYDQYDAGSPPILMMHGALDRISPEWEAQDMLARATERHVPAAVIEVRDVGHGWYPFERHDVRTEASACSLMQLYRDRLLSSR